MYDVVSLDGLQENLDWDTETEIPSYIIYLLYPTPTPTLYTLMLLLAICYNYNYDIIIYIIL